MNRLQEKYKTAVVPALTSKYGYTSVMQCPKIEKVVINWGVGDAISNPKALDEAVKENKLEVVSRPDIDVKQIEKGKDLIFTAVMQTKPEAELGKYKGVEIEKIEYKVSEKDIEHELGHMQEHNSRLVSIEDRPVEKGDIATIDFEGFVDGKAFDGGKAEGHELEIGSNTFIPGFEDQIIGMKIDEEKDINVKFPE